MSPSEFIKKWGPGGPAYDLNEKQGAQSHFLDLCELLNVSKPGTERDYLFEKTHLVLGSERGYADVFKRDHFAWENKAPGKNLDAALKQLLPYSLALGNPPLLVVSDRLEIRIHTKFNGHPSEAYKVLLHELVQPEKQELLRNLWLNPESFRPKLTTREITQQAADSFATLAQQMRLRGHAPEKVSHFLTQCLFCLFAEDVGLLPEHILERLLRNRDASKERLTKGLENLFVAMRDGGLYGPDDISWFNGGLFKNIDVPDLEEADIAELRTAALLNWKFIDVSIFGTLFERGLDPTKRIELGAHYTDPATIERIIDPVIRRPLLLEWEDTKREIAHLAAKIDKKGDRYYRAAHSRFIAWLERLRLYRVLDPACGSGNFLYLALKALKNIEHQSQLDVIELGLEREQDLVTGPENMLGIEINEYAAELARVTVWIGELQWRIEHGYSFKTNPVLEALDHIECRDAIIVRPSNQFANAQLEQEADWPQADVVIGNPPFIGDKKMRGELGSRIVDGLRKVYEGRVPGGADLVCYWFEKVRMQINSNKLHHAGLVTTNSIRSGKNRFVIDRLTEVVPIFEAWSDEPWVNDGAAVRVAMICIGNVFQQPKLNGQAVSKIFADLTANDIDGIGVDLTKAQKLSANLKCSFQGVIPRAEVKRKIKEELRLPDASFNVGGKDARFMLRQPCTPSGEPMSNVIFPYWIADDITSRPLDRFIINFKDRPIEDASLFEVPFKAISSVRLHREQMDESKESRNWWQLARWRPEMLKKLEPLSRFICIPRVSKHHLCAWAPKEVVPDNAIVVVARDDDTTFGILQSRIHRVWALSRGSTLEDRPRYTPTTCFEEFPFPVGLTPADTSSQTSETLENGAVIPGSLSLEIRHHAEMIALAAKKLDDTRKNWLNPPDWTLHEPEVVPLGMKQSPYVDRIVPKFGFEKDLLPRTLTNLYNESPEWLKILHATLDLSVARAYGWDDYTKELPDREILSRLLVLNLHSNA